MHSLMHGHPSGLVRMLMLIMLMLLVIKITTKITLCILSCTAIQVQVAWWPNSILSLRHIFHSHRFPTSLHEFQDFLFPIRYKTNSRQTKQDLYSHTSKILCTGKLTVDNAYSSVSVSQIYFMKDYMMGPLQMPKIMSSYEADRLLCWN